MSFGLRLRLFVMMFLQYFVWGLWLPVLYQWIGPNGLNLSNMQIAYIFMVYGFGAILGPFVIGQLADRYFATEKVMAVAHLIGGVLLLATTQMSTFWPIFVLLFVYCNLYMPTMALSNSITFRSLGDERQDQFAIIRMFGTIGWIAAGLFFTAYRRSADLPALKPLFDMVGQPSSRDCLRIAGIVSLIYGVYCFLLPHTPPVPAKETDPIDKKSAVLESLELLRHRSFAILIFVSGLIGIMLAFYFQLENPFLEAIGTPAADTGGYMTIGQIAEWAVMPLVPLAVATFGVKRTMLIGAGGWALRFLLSMIGQPWWLMIATIGFHGFCFGFFFVVAQMFVDRAASGDIKASAQNLFVFIVYGIGTIAGNLLAGFIKDTFTTTDKVTNWTAVWAGPFVMTLICMALFALLFREEEKIAKPVGEPVEV